MRDLVVGDVVRLVGLDGPIMTVTGLSGTQGAHHRQMAHVMWPAKDGTMQSEIIDRRALVAYHLNGPPKRDA